jgi:hypothetical protein
MLTTPVPDYFQEEGEDALSSRIRWLEAEISLGDLFFARLLGIDQETFARWKERRADLPRHELHALGEVWELMMHILSFVSFETARARKLLEHVPSTVSGQGMASTAPPWIGSSIKSYLETHGLGAVEDVNRWVTSFRFGAPSLAPEQGLPCPSSPD